MKFKRIFNRIFPKKEKELTVSFGGYMSVDRDEALSKNWDLLLKITEPLRKKKLKMKLKEKLAEMYSNDQELYKYSIRAYLAGFERAKQMACEVVKEQDEAGMRIVNLLEIMRQLGEDEV